MRAFESIRTRIDTEDTDALYARDFSHVPCLCRDRQMPVDTSRIQPTIDRVGARTSPESALKPKPLIFILFLIQKRSFLYGPAFKLQYCLWICPWGHLPFWEVIPRGFLSPGARPSPLRCAAALPHDEHAPWPLPFRPGTIVKQPADSAQDLFGLIRILPSRETTAGVAALRAPPPGRRRGSRRQ